jgi:hypothetical protein
MYPEMTEAQPAQPSPGDTNRGKMTPDGRRAVAETTTQAMHKRTVYMITGELCKCGPPVEVPSYPCSRERDDDDDDIL